jgi:hypothetical protein
MSDLPDGHVWVALKRRKEPVDLTKCREYEVYSMVRDDPPERSFDWHRPSQRSRYFYWLIGTKFWFRKVDADAVNDRTDWRLGVASGSRSGPLAPATTVIDTTDASLCRPLVGWKLETGPHQSTYYLHVHPVQVVRALLEAKMLLPDQLPPELAPYREQATDENNVEWLKELEKMSPESCNECIEAPPGPNDARNEYCYSERKKGTKLEAIRRAVNSREGWKRLASAQSVTDAADAHVKKHDLPIIRTHERKRIQENSETKRLKTPE